MGPYPVMLALVMDLINGVPLTLHRTYLAVNGTGKAEVGDEDAKRLLGTPGVDTCSGGGIPLASLCNTTIVGVAEGIETALAVTKATGMPMIACVSASMLASIKLPTHISRVVIWADNDTEKYGKRVGQLKAKELEERLIAEKRIVLTQVAPCINGKDGVDWLDLLNTLGKEPFKRIQMIPARHVA